MKKKTKIIIAVLAVLAVIAAEGIYLSMNTGKMSLVIKVIPLEGKEVVYNVETKEQYLGAALTKEGMLEGYVGDYGLYITAVTGITADEAKQQWWCLTKDTQSVDTGIDSVEIADGEVYELTLKQGYDDWQ